MKKLTNREMEIMDAFWESDKPLTSVDLFQSHEAEGWTRNFVQNVVAKLVKKEFIEQCGMVRYNTQYARVFKPRVTREEYSSVLMENMDVNLDNVSDVVVDFARIDKKEERSILVSRLEKSLGRLRRLKI